MNIGYTANDQQVYECELRDWLPKKIFDAHVHIFDDNNFLSGYEQPEKSCYRKFGGTFPLPLWQQWLKTLLPQQECSLLCFGGPDRQSNLAGADRYIGSIVDNQTVFGMSLLSPKEDFAAVKQRIIDYNLVGYKPYRCFVDWKDDEDVTIFDMLPDEQMAFANEQHLAITLHIPKAKRLADPVNQQQMVELCQRYPDTKIIFAHIGRAYYMQNVIGYLDGIAKCQNAYLDTAMVNHPEVLEYTFNNFPRERIIFGSDAPIAFLRGKSVEINNQYAYLMGEDYRIGNAIFDNEHIVNFTFFFYEQLRAIKVAAEKAAMTRNEIENFFYHNAMRIVKN